MSAAVNRREVKRRWSQRCGQETSTPGGSRRDLVVGAWKGLAAMAKAMRGGERGTMHTVSHRLQSRVVLCCVMLRAPTTLESLRTEGGLAIKDAGDPLDTPLRTQAGTGIDYGKQRTPSNRRDC